MLDKIKINNIKQIMLCLMKRSYATKAEIVEDTELSTSTVSSCVNSLLKLKLLVVNGMEDSSGGRRSTIYRVNAKYGCFIGLDLRPEIIHCVVSDCQMRPLKEFDYVLTDKVTVISAIDEILKCLIAENKNVLGIGVAICAKMDYKEQVILQADFYNWKHVHLKEIIERQHMIFTHIDHPVNAGAIYEGSMGSARGEKNYLYVSENIKGKAALVLDGRICRGADNFTGKIINDSIKSLLNKPILDFLGISRLLAAYDSEEFKNEISALHEEDGIKINCIKHTKSTYCIGIATVTQREWFESIYFML